MVSSTDTDQLTLYRRLWAAAAHQVIEQADPAGVNEIGEQISSFVY
jgi:hypothetical protein